MKTYLEAVTMGSCCILNRGISLMWDFCVVARKTKEDFSCTRRKKTQIAPKFDSFVCVPNATGSILDSISKFLRSSPASGGSSMKTPGRRYRSPRKEKVYSGASRVVKGLFSCETRNLHTVHLDTLEKTGFILELTR